MIYFSEGDLPLHFFPLHIFPSILVGMKHFMYPPGVPTYAVNILTYDALLLRCCAPIESLLLDLQDLVSILTF